MNRHPRLALLLFWPALAVWTWLLLKPNPFPELARRLADWSDLLLFLATKTLHMSVYAGLTLVGLVGGGRRRTQWVPAVLLAHAVLTEAGQYLGELWFATHRSGTVRDVLIDWTGVAAGYAAWRLVRRIWPGIAELNGKEEKKTDQECEPEQAG